MTMIANTETLQRVPCIWYPVQFSSNPEVYALLDSGNEVNAMTTTYTANLGLVICKTDVGTQKVDGSVLEIYGMVIASFSV